ncbi:unnamed protein product [Schistosoma spindalis]|nr:unnamed protein product [Schistosoma spindale]
MMKTPQSSHPTHSTIHLNSIEFSLKIICKPTQLESDHLHDQELIAGQNYLRLHPISDTVFFIFTKGILDYEMNPRVSLLIDCYDLANIESFDQVHFTLQHIQQMDPFIQSYSFRITVAISDQNDNLPIFKQSKYYITIPEHLPDDSYITEMKAYDLDNGKYAQLTYQLNSITFNYIDDDHDQDDHHDHDHDDEDLLEHSEHSRYPSQHEQPFQIHPITGIITVLHNQLLDRELIEYFCLLISAIDKGNLTTKTQLIIQLLDINDHLPILHNPINIDFQENQKINTFIDFIHLIDLDKDSKNSRIHLLLNNNQYQSINHLPINNQSITHRLINNQSINNPYNNYIKIIPDINFNYAEMNKNQLINEYELKAKLISQLIIDREKINKIFYKIITYNDNTNIKQISSITYTLTINILDENDNIPICIYPHYNSIIGYDDQDLDHDHDPDPDQDPNHDHPIMIYTNTPIYTLILQIKGYDPDHHLNGTILYELNQFTNGSPYFYLNESNGKLYTNWLIDNLYDSYHMDTNPSHHPPIDGIYQIKILLKDMGIPSLSNETQFFIKIHSFHISQSIIHNQSIDLNQTFTFWLYNHHHHHQFLLIALIISLILLIMIISSIIIWIKSSCQEKLSLIHKTECNPIIITTQKDQSLKKPYCINCLSTNKKYQYSSKIDNNNNTNNNNHNNRLNWPVTNIIHQSINDRHRYSTHDSINNNLNIITTTTAHTTINTTNQDLYSYTNHLHTNPICSFTFPYDTSNHSNNNNNNNDDYDDHQSIRQKVTLSLDSSNLNYSIYNRSIHETFINDQFNNDVYKQSLYHRTFGNSIIYSGYTNSYLSSIHDVIDYDSYQRQQRNMKSQ